MFVVDTGNETVDYVTAIHYVNAFKSNACAKLMKLNLHILIEENYMFSFYYKKWGKGNLMIFVGPLVLLLWTFTDVTSGNH